MPLTLNDIDLPPNVEGKLHRGLLFNRYVNFKSKSFI